MQLPELEETTDVLEGCADIDADVPPPMLDLSRLTTIDGYEPHDMYLWPGGDPNAKMEVMDAQFGWCENIDVSDVPPCQAEVCRLVTLDGFEVGPTHIALSKAASYEHDDAPIAPPCGSELCRFVSVDGFEACPQDLASSCDAQVVPAAQAVLMPPMISAVMGNHIAMLPVVQLGCAYCEACGHESAKIEDPMMVAQQTQVAGGMPEGAVQDLQQVGGEEAPVKGVEALASEATDQAGTFQFKQDSQASSDSAVPVVGAVAARPRAQSLEVEHDVAGGTFRIWWVVDARKLSGSDCQAASAAFTLALSRGSGQFKFILRPTASGTARGHASFKKAKGRGCVEVRCLEEVDGAQPLTFRLAVGGRHVWGEEARGPFTHGFAERALYTLPEAVREWDFSSHVDRETQTFEVCLEISEGVSGAWAA